MSRFVYHNENPYGLHEEDCVVRAITLASGLPYEEIEEKLWLTAELYSCDTLCKYCYSNFLTNVMKYQEVNADGLTVRDFIDKHPMGTYLIRVPFHLTCVIDGVCYDIWNCLDEICDTVWRVD